MTDTSHVSDAYFPSEKTETRKKKKRYDENLENLVRVTRVTLIGVISIKICILLLSNCCSSMENKKSIKILRDRCNFHSFLYNFIFMSV